MSLKFKKNPRGSQHPWADIHARLAIVKHGRCPIRLTRLAGVHHTARAALAFSNSAVK